MLNVAPMVMYVHMPILELLSPNWLVAQFYNRMGRVHAVLRDLINPQHNGKLYHTIVAEECSYTFLLI